MKFFLLTAGEHLYPEAGDRDWIGTFETEEDAESYVKKVTAGGYEHYVIEGGRYDWYKIIDLKRWIES